MTTQNTNASSPAVHPIVPREKLDFGLDDPSIPKYWFGGDAFKTRFFDAMSLIFPPGEKFFMVTVRDFRDRITDPKLLQDIKDFNRQEAQHGMVHRQDNDRLRKQGIDVDSLTQYVDDLQQRQEATAADGRLGARHGAREAAGVQGARSAGGAAGGQRAAAARGVARREAGDRAAGAAANSDSF